MNSLLIAVLLLLALLSSTFAVGPQLTYTFLRPADSKLPASLTPDENGDALPWGLSMFLNVTPSYSDLLDDGSSGSISATDNNNTDYRWTFSSFPDMLTFSPSSLTFRVTVPATVTDGTIDDATEVVFTPPWQLVRYWPTKMNVTTGVNNDPIWSFNVTIPGGPYIPNSYGVDLGYLEECLANGVRCTNVANLTYPQNITDFTEPSLRPIAITVSNEDSYFNSLSGLDSPLSVTTIPFLPSPPLVISLPLQDGNKPLGTRVITGSANGPLVAYDTPGRDNAGGNLTISIYSVWRSYNFNDTFEVWEPADGAVTLSPSSLTIDANKPGGVCTLNADAGWSATVGGIEYPINSYRIFWRVVEASATPSLVADGGYPQGAYSLASVELERDSIDFSIIDLSVPSDGGAILISPRKTGSYRYHALVEFSPLDLGMGVDGTITYPFQISPPGSIRILVADSINPSSFTPVNSFVWTGAQRVIEFVLDTQDAPTGLYGFNWTFSDPLFVPPRALEAFNLLPGVYHLRLEPNEVRVRAVPQNSFNTFDWVTPGQPFSLLFEWTPPTTTGFLINVNALNVQYPDGRVSGSMTFTVGANKTGYLAGPFILLDTASPLGKDESDQLILPIEVTFSNLSGAADNQWFVTNSPVLLPVSRHGLFLVNQPMTGELPTKIVDKRTKVDLTARDSWTTYDLSAGGFLSEPFCVGVTMQSRFFVNDQQEIWVTPWAESLAPASPSNSPSDGSPWQLENRNGLIFVVDNPAPAAGVSREGMPPGTMVLSRANNGTGCFRIAFDRNWPFLSKPLLSDVMEAVHEWLAGEVPEEVADNEFYQELQNGLGFWRVNVAVGGPSGPMVFEQAAVDLGYLSNVFRMPDLFIVRRPTVQWFALVSENADDDDDGTLDNPKLHAGDSAVMYIALSEPAQEGLNYLVTCTSCTLAPLNVTTGPDGRPLFAPGSIGPHMWRVTFDALPPQEFGTFYAQSVPLSYNTLFSTLSFWPSGPDAAYFVPPQKKTFSIRPRELLVPTFDPAVTLIGFPFGPFPVTSGTVKNDVTVVPVPFGSAERVLSFDPPQLTFTADGPRTQFVTIHVDEDFAPYQLGSYSWSWRLTGTDANITWLHFSKSVVSTLGVTRRPAPILPSPDDLIQEIVYAGVTYGPFDIQLEIPLLADEPEGLTFTPIADGVAFVPPTITFLPGQFQQTFSARFEPVDNGIHHINWVMGGPHAWKYEVPDTLAFEYGTWLRSFHPYLIGKGSFFVRGGTYSMGIALPMPTPSSVTITPHANWVTFSPSSVTFTADSFTSSNSLEQFLTFTVADDAPTNDYGIPPIVTYTVSGPDAAYYDGEDLDSPIRLFFSDRTFRWVGLPQILQTLSAVFMLNHPSLPFQLEVYSEPESPLTVTFSSQFLEFQPSSLTFGPGMLVQSVVFTPIQIPAGQSYGSALNHSFVGIHWVDVQISGAEAELYDVTSIRNIFSTTFMAIIPEIDVSPIAPIYTDGRSEEDVWVSIKDGGELSNGLPTAAVPSGGFTLHIIPSLNNVYVEPGVLEFSTATTGALRSFSIAHTNPVGFGQQTAYDLKYLLKYAGQHAWEALDITSFVPDHARRVLLRRYSIIPQFPKVLSFEWQEASFNISRPPSGTFALLPKMPLNDGQATQFAYGGHATPGGRVQFEPPTVVFAPGQTVQTFLVKAIRGIASGAEALYYRVDWDIVAHPSDSVNFIEYISEDGNGDFSTWHVAGAVLSTAQISLALVACFVLATLGVAL